MVGHPEVNRTLFLGNGWRSEIERQRTLSFAGAHTSRVGELKRNDKRQISVAYMRAVTCAALDMLFSRRSNRIRAAPAVAIRLDPLIRRM